MATHLRLRLLRLLLLLPLVNSAWQGPVNSCTATQGVGRALAGLEARPQLEAQQLEARGEQLGSRRSRRRCKARPGLVVRVLHGINAPAINWHAQMPEGDLAGPPVGG